MADELNRAVTNMRRYCDALLARDWEVLADLVAAGHHFEDRRLGMRTVLDRAGNIAQAQILAELAGEDDAAIDLDIVATRGPRHALVKQTYRAKDYTVIVLALIEVDDADRTTKFMTFDDSDMDEALAALRSLAAPEM